MDVDDTDTNSDDATLLRRFIATRDQPAFARLVRRHVDLVYSAARRQLRDDAAAQDVTQQVFVLLAEKGARVRDGEAVAGWLLVTTRYVALNAIRSETRRRRHEREAAVMQHERQSEASPAWDQVAPMLDEAVARLKREDRDALALRYFQGRSVADVAAALGVSQDAAQKRLSRALEKLRDLFARRGVTTSAEALSSVLLANALVVAPAALGSGVAGAALGSAAVSSGKGAGTVLAMLNLKAVAASVAALLVAGVTTTVAVQQMRTPSGKARQVRVPEAAAAKGTAAANTWRPRFDAVYRLGPDEILKRVPPPFIAERLDFYRATSASQADAIPAGPDALMLTQAPGGRLESRAMRFGGSLNVRDVLRRVVGISPQEVELPREVMATQLPGDWVFLPAAPPEQRLAALSSLLTRELRLPRQEFVRLPRERDVIVVAGTYAYRPLPGMPPDRRNVHLFIGEPDKDKNGAGGGGGGGMAQAFEYLSDVTGYPVVLETDLAKSPPINWRFHRSFSGVEFHRAEPTAAAQLDQVLANIEKQTSLTLRRERRTIPMWVPEPDAAATPTTTAATPR